MDSVTGLRNPMTMQEGAAIFLFSGSQVSQVGSGTGLKTMGKPLAKTG